MINTQVQDPGKTEVRYQKGETDMMNRTLVPDPANLGSSHDSLMTRCPNCRTQGPRRKIEF